MKGDTREQRPTTTTTSEAIDEAASLETNRMFCVIRFDTHGFCKKLSSVNVRIANVRKQVMFDTLSLKVVS